MVIVQFDCVVDMNIYPNMLTPPTEDSSYAEMTSSTYDEMINHFQMDQGSYINHKQMDFIVDMF